MINYLKKFLNNTESNNDEIPDNIMSIIIDSTGKVKIRLNIQNVSVLEAHRFAHMLYNLQSDHYQQTIIDLLISLSEQSEEYRLFSKTVVENWSQKILANEQNNDSNSPIISPSNFSKNNT